MALDIKQGFSRQLTRINMKTSTFMEENRLKTYIATLESDIADLKAQIGELGYNLWKEDKFDGEKLFPLFQEISEKYQLIQEQEKQIQEMEDKNRQILGKSQGGGATAAPAENICPQCGGACAPNVNFCMQCGAKLK